MHMVRHDREFMDEPAVCFAAFVEEIGETLFDARIEHFASVLWNEDNVVEQSVHRIPAMPEHYFRRLGHWRDDSAVGRRALGYPPR